MFTCMCTVLHTHAYVSSTPWPKQRHVALATCSRLKPTWCHRMNMTKHSTSVVATMAAAARPVLYLCVWCGWRGGGAHESHKCGIYIPFCRCCCRVASMKTAAPHALHTHTPSHPHRLTHAYTHPHRLTPSHMDTHPCTSRQAADALGLRKRRCGDAGVGEGGVCEVGRLDVGVGEGLGIDCVCARVCT